jgi:5-oxopent-3-ene-1,2,5-tricarboxylate decarboxylase/2-hydroxyhepta-2,4-diene-1,7-dioate isomerase
VSVTLQRNGEPFELEPSKIVATHLSYRSRCDEYRMASPPEFPSYFLKPPSSVSAHEAPVARPRGCCFLNYEGEIAVVIGRRCRGVSRDDSARPRRRLHGRQRLRRPRLPPHRPGLDAGSRARTGSARSPVLADATDVDPGALVVRTPTSTASSSRRAAPRPTSCSFDYQIADVSRLITLERGDVLLTGTPANSRPVEPGDVVEVEVEGIGRLRNRIVESDRELADVGARPEVSAQTLHVALAMPEDQAEREVAEGKWTRTTNN